MQACVAGDESRSHAGQPATEVESLEGQAQTLIGALARRQSSLQCPAQIEGQLVGMPAAKRQVTAHSREAGFAFEARSRDSSRCIRIDIADETR